MSKRKEEVINEVWQESHDFIKEIGGKYLKKTDSSKRLYKLEMENCSDRCCEIGSHLSVDYIC